VSPTESNSGPEAGRLTCAGEPPRPAADQRLRREVAGLGRGVLALLTGECQRARLQRALLTGKREKGGCGRERGIFGAGGAACMVIGACHG